LGFEFIKVVVYILPWREPKISALKKNKPVGEAGAQTTAKAMKSQYGVRSNYNYKIGW
jgi:hypothetical protein